jgi:hypothetical protein
MPWIIQINTNLLETNVVNLAIVVTIVVTYVGDEVNRILEDRRCLLVSNFQTAVDMEKRLLEKRTEVASIVADARQYDQRTEMELSLISTQEKHIIKQRLDEQKELLLSEKEITIASKKQAKNRWIIIYTISRACRHAKQFFLLNFPSQTPWRRHQKQRRIAYYIKSKLE